MSKRRKKGTHKRRRRHGVGKINAGGLLMQVGGVALGAFAAQAINKAVGSKVNPKVLNAGLIAGGALLVPKFFKGPIGAAAGMGLVAVGTIAGLQSFGVLSGIGADDDTIVYAVNGTGDEQNLIGDADDGIGDADDDTYGGMDPRGYDDGVAGISDDDALIAGIGEDDF